MSRLRAALCLLLALGCGPQDDEAGFGGGGTRPSGGSGVDNDEGETGDVSPVIVDVRAGFDDLGGSWVVAFEVSYDYPHEMLGGLVFLDVQKDEGQSQSVDIEIGSSDAPIDDGNIVFAVRSIDGNIATTSAYSWSIQLESPEGTESEVETGRVDPIR